MARAPKTTAAPTKATGTAVANWDEELARQAQMATAMEDSTATGQFFGLKGGQLTFNDAPMPNNQMGVIIVGAVLENVFYEGDYDPDTPQSPTCFAFAKDESELAPHKVVVEAGNAQHETCKGCEHNEWGSADKGRGKACRNVRRLAMIPAGNFNANTGKFEPFGDADHYETAQIAFMKLPVTSVKGYAAFVKQVAGALKRPPHGIFTRVKVVPDPKSQFKVLFEPISQVPNHLLGAVMKRHEEAMSTIDFPYTPADEAPPEPPKKGRGKAAPTKKGRY